MTEQKDKTAFIKFRLLPGSRASKFMQATVFCGQQEWNDYKTFLTNFLDAFDWEDKANIVRCVIHAVESIQQNMAAKELH